MPQLSPGSQEQLNRDLHKIFDSFTDPVQIQRRLNKEKQQKFIENNQKRLGL